MLKKIFCISFNIIIGCASISYAGTAPTCTEPTLAWVDSVGSGGGHNDIVIDPFIGDYYITVGGYGNTFPPFNFPQTATFQISPPGAPIFNLPISQSFLTIGYEPSGVNVGPNFTLSHPNLFNTINQLKYDGNNNLYMVGYLNSFNQTYPQTINLNLVNTPAFPLEQPDNLTINDDTVFISKYGLYQYNYTRYIEKRTALSPTGSASFFVNDIEFDDQNNVYVVGYFTGAVDFNSINGQDDVRTSNVRNLFVTRYNANGSYAWTYIPSVGETDSWGFRYGGNGKLVITGAAFSSVDFADGKGLQAGYGGVDGFVVVLGTDGLAQNSFLFGSAQSDRPGALEVDQAGNIYVGGIFADTAEFAPIINGANSVVLQGPPPLFPGFYPTDAFLVSYDSSLSTVRWIEHTSVGPSYKINPWALKLNGCNELILAGNISSTAGAVIPGVGTMVSGQDIAFRKYDISNGVNIWSFVTGTQDQEYFHELAISNVGDILAIANTSAGYTGVFKYFDNDLNCGCF